MKSLEGHLLIAIPSLQDANFFRSVVLMFQHSVEGASGVILNHVSDVDVSRVWDEVAQLPCACDDPVYIGGPVDGPLIALHSNSNLAELNIIPGVFLTTEREKLNELVAKAPKRFKLVSGYSGWGPGQLESELEQGGWLTLPATADIVFDSPDGMWKQVCELVGNDILESNASIRLPSDPSLN